MATFGINRNLKFPKPNHKTQNIKYLVFLTQEKYSILFYYRNLFVTLQMKAGYPHAHPYKMYETITAQY